MPEVTPIRSFTAIVNPAAGGRGGRSAARPLTPLAPLARALRDAGAEVEVEYSRDLGHAVELARSAAAGRPGHVVLGVGGDGMIGAVGGALAGTGSLFGIVPAGRGNDFARQVGMPSDAAPLAALLLSGAPKPVDTIRCNGIAVLGSVYAGVDAVANRNANRSRLLRGSASYYMGALRAVATWRPVAYRVTVDGEPYERNGYTVVVANSGFYGFGRRIAPTATVDDGVLDVVIIRDGPKSMFFAVMKALEDGSHVRRPEVEVLRGRKVRVEADRALPYGADGEVDGTLPVAAEVMPGALALIRP